MSAPRYRDPVDTSRNSYCGPYALAHLAGMEATDEASALVREEVSPYRRQVQRMRAGEVLEGLRRNGIRPIGRGRPPRKDRPTLARWLKGRRGGRYLVQVTGHFIVVDGWHIYDNAHPTGRKWKDWPHRRKRVVAWWEFDK